MAMLPRFIRYRLFDFLSKTTMRYVEAAPRGKANPLAEEVYRQINRDFFVNGSLTSRSKVTNIFAATWMAGRETIIVDDKLDRITKEAIAATLSSVNDCPYCGDMLVSLVHAGDKHDSASAIFEGRQDDIEDSRMRELLNWVLEAATPGSPFPSNVPFTEEEMPEVLGSMMAMADINAFSHVVMDGSPVSAPLGSDKLKAIVLRIFATELGPTQAAEVPPGEGLKLVPAATLPEDMQWATGNPRIADAIGRWIAAVNREVSSAVSGKTIEFVESTLNAWDGAPPPMSRAWVEKDMIHAPEKEQHIIRLALVMSKAKYQLDDELIEQVLNDCPDQETFIRILAWCSNLSARCLVRNIARQLPMAAVKAA